MGTAVAKRSIWAVIAENPFPHFDAETFRSGVATRLQSYAERAGGFVTSPPLRSESGEIFRLHLMDIPFPDGPGRGSLEVVAYKAFGRLYLSAILHHDRLFRSVDGLPSGRLYLHDFTFVRSYEGQRTPVLKEIDEALDGLDRARHAVQVKNRAAGGSRSPLARIRIALQGVLESNPALTSTPVQPARSPHRSAHRRKEVLAALRDEERRPRRVRIRRRPKTDRDDEAR